MKCKKCNATLDEYIDICPGCGAIAKECSSCGKMNDKENENCESCGLALDTSVTKKVIKVERTSFYDFFNKKPVKITLISIVSVVVLSLVVMITYNLLKEDGIRLLYIKDGALYSIENFDEKPKKIFTKDNLYFGRLIISQNGKRLFYTESEKYVGDVLFYLDLTNENKPKKLATNITNFLINRNGDVVYFVIKSKLYCSNLKRSVVVAEGVESYYITPDGDKALFSLNGSIYMYSRRKNENVLICSGANIKKYTSDFSKIYFTQKGKLLLYKNGVLEELVNDLREVVEIYDSGNIYYYNTEGMLCYFNDGEITAIGKGKYIALNKNSPQLIIMDKGIYYLVIKDEIKEVESLKDRDVRNITFNKQGTLLYYYDFENTRVFKIYDIENNVITIIDRNVTRYSLVHDKLVYMSGNDLYVDNEKVDTYVNMLLYDSKGNIIYTKSDLAISAAYSSDIFVYNGHESNLKVNDILSFSYYGPNSIVYIRENANKGYDLYYYDGENETLLDTNVTHVLRSFINIYGYTEGFGEEAYGEDTKLVFNEFFDGGF